MDVIVLCCYRFVLFNLREPDVIGDEKSPYRCLLCLRLIW